VPLSGLVRAEGRSHLSNVDRLVDGPVRQWMPHCGGWDANSCVVWCTLVRVARCSARTELSCTFRECVVLFRLCGRAARSSLKRPGRTANNNKIPQSLLTGYTAFASRSSDTRIHGTKQVTIEHSRVHQTSTARRRCRTPLRVSVHANALHTVPMRHAHAHSPRATTRPASHHTNRARLRPLTRRRSHTYTVAVAGE
jgi:hypothetical protein